MSSIIQNINKARCNDREYKRKPYEAREHLRFCCCTYRMQLKQEEALRAPLRGRSARAPRGAGAPPFAGLRWLGGRCFWILGGAWVSMAVSSRVVWRFSCLTKTLIKPMVSLKIGGRDLGCLCLDMQSIIFRFTGAKKKNSHFAWEVL